ncbi:imidazole glycerol phosphate synthase subunit HisH [Prochlorococcus marinus XMU1412]|uniref:imidazole glycerol phosphate synthase subunit HisH n=1 Tax=Prochlorococcus marinus TaxID=1219 RepID=UPI001ADA480F|nr:imidazole glycerol phosphate synthase subunit HisH [Prochlorococcus marinus]MBO8240523.1 imidazole glycerol phosphate synthase subunit HisH [Prochlorococcus marinus XMU1412]MBW3071757.1 imidazole glycerol phosphate synthase subunit HisH [Prochlorococcus marinus str. MU1412]
MDKFPKVGILDYGTGNIASLFKALKTIGSSPYLVTDKTKLKQSKSLILPGVGHFGEAIKSLKKNEMIENLNYLVSSGVPILGICLGFQLLTNSSEESPEENGLGIFPMKTIKINPCNKTKIKVPHMGWNSIENINKQLKLFRNIKFQNQLFFFSNGYGIRKNHSNIINTANYLHEIEWVAIAEKRNVFGVQFHPEKSRSQGLTLLKNFLSIS